jgi:quinoprotein glucose dehydrogenase
MPAPQSGSAMTYLLNGEQYIVVAISGANYSGELLAFRLPASSPASPGSPMNSSARPAAGPIARPAASVWSGVYSDEQARRGQTLYGQQCGACHGQALEGVEMAPALAGGDFLDRWSGQTVGDLFQRIRTTMPLGRAGRLSPEAYSDITAYILSANSFPPGRTELPRDAQILKQIRIDSTKPDQK